MDPGDQSPLSMQARRSGGSGSHAPVAVGANVHLVLQRGGLEAGQAARDTLPLASNNESLESLHFRGETRGMNEWEKTAAGDGN